ncbi:MAG: hypothetical protein LC624_06990 [Halobacteriales archaeon]|nr:hypothetical protein [Halobacteriales archaeon]
MTFLETPQATDNVIVGVNSRRADQGGRDQVPLDSGKGTGNSLMKGVTLLWERIDAVVPRGDSVCEEHGVGRVHPPGARVVIGGSAYGARRGFATPEGFHSVR